MARTRVKFCGITRASDAIAAASAGADAIGLIFHPKSPRYVSLMQAREILRSAPPMVMPVGLFVNHPVFQVKEIAGQLNLRTLQLHGDESPDYLAELDGYTIIKAVRCDLATMESTLAKWAGAAALLLETPHPTAAGGTGVENDWAGIEAVLKRRTNLPPLIAAGGLTPENVGSVIRRLRPYAVDVSTGIEQSPGVKSVDKMQRFTKQVRLSDETAHL